jgi:hypothetical protein
VGSKLLSVASTSPQKTKRAAAKQKTTTTVLSTLKE